MGVAGQLRRETPPPLASATAVDSGACVSAPAKCSTSGPQSAAADTADDYSNTFEDTEQSSTHSPPAKSQKQGNK